MSTPETFLIAITIIFIVPWLLWRFGNMDYYAPLMVVQIIAGILLGPCILGRTLPDHYPSSSIRPSYSRSTASLGGR